MLKRLLEKYCVSAALALPYWVTPKAKEAIEKGEKAVDAGSISADDKAKFLKAATDILKNGKQVIHEYTLTKEFKENYPNYEVLLSFVKEDEPARLELLKKIKPSDKYGSFSSDDSLKRYISNTQMIIDFRALTAKVKTLETVGEITKKVKEDPAKNAPVSVNFKNYDFLKWYSPKYQKMIIEVIPEIDKVLERGWVSSKDVRKWDAIFNKHSTPGLSAHNLQRHNNNNNMYTGKDTPVAKEVAKDFKVVQDIFEKLESLETEKEQKQKVAKDRSWSPAADVLEKKLKDIISEIIAKLKTDLKEDNIEQVQRLFDFVHQNKFKAFRELPADRRKYIDREVLKWVADANDNFVQTLEKDKIAEWATKKANKTADGIATHFVQKNLLKLAPLLKLKPLKDIIVNAATVNNGAVHSLMTFTFEDKSSFEVQNKIVFGYSKYGVSFARYPTTFHNVVIKGAPMKGPSEDNVYREFAGEGAPKVEATFRQQVQSKFCVKEK